MVNSGHAIGGRGTFIKHVEGLALPDFNALLKGLFLVPDIENLAVNSRQIEAFIFGILVTHYISTYYDTIFDFQNVYKDIRFNYIINMYFLASPPTPSPRGEGKNALFNVCAIGFGDKGNN
jgi:hypothetical protein